MGEVNTLLADEVQLMDWGESRAAGPWIKLRLSDTDCLEVFRGMDTATMKKTGHIFEMLLAESAQDPHHVTKHPPQAAKQTKPYGQEARELKLSNFCRTPAVWNALFTDREFLDWLKTQKCAAPDWQLKCSGDVVAAHVLRIANGAGMGKKPEYSAVPLCDRHHQLQHQQGESAFSDSLGFTGKDWFDKQRIKYLSEFAWERLKLQVAGSRTSMGEIPPSKLATWCSALGIDEYLPNAYR